MKTPRHISRLIGMTVVGLASAALAAPVAFATLEGPGDLPTRDVVVSAPLRNPVQGEDASSISAIPDVQVVVTENSNYNTSHSGEAVPESSNSLDASVVITDNSFYNATHTGEAAPSSDLSLDAPTVITDNSFYNSTHTGEAAPSADLSNDASVVLTENSDYDFSHNGEVINLRTKSHPRPAGHEDGGKDASLGL